MDIILSGLYKLRCLTLSKKVVSLLRRRKGRVREIVKSRYDMDDEMNLGGWRMCREARVLVREIYRKLPDAGKNSFHTQVRRVATQMLCNLSESQTEKSRKQAYFLLAQSRSACMEMCHMFRSPRYYRYLPEDVCGNLDVFCRKLVRQIGKEMEKIKPGRRRLHTVRPGLRARKKTGGSGRGTVKGKE